MKFPLPQHSGYSRQQTAFGRYRQSWWQKCSLSLFKSKPRYSFKAIQTTQSKLKKFDKFISIILFILIIAGILIIKSVLHLYQSHPSKPLEIIDLTKTNNPNINIPDDNKFDKVITKIIPKQKVSIKQDNDNNNNDNDKIHIAENPETKDSISSNKDNIKPIIKSELPVTLQNILSKEARNYDEFDDWWKCPIIDDNKPKSKALRDLHVIRKQMIEHKLLKKGNILSVSNQRNNVSECVIFKEFDISTDKTIKWRADNNDLCPWMNTALFWSAMDGTHIGVDIKNMESPNMENHWMFEFKQYIPNQCICSNNILFLYFNNINANNMFIKSMNKCSDQCLLYDITPNTNNNLLHSLLNFLNNKIALQLKVDYIMVISGDDTTLMLQDFDIDSTMDLSAELIARFNYYQCEMLICGAANSYPHWQRDAQGFENKVNRWSRHHQHINANIFMINGGITNFKHYIDLIKQNYDEYAQDITKWNFQAAIRELHQKYYPKIKVDSLAKIWTRVDQWMCDP